MVHLALSAAEGLADEGIELEVVDLRTLVPLDEETILSSFRKTNRVIILHEAPRRGGVGAELESLIVEKAFDHLAAAPIRIAAKMMPALRAPGRRISTCRRAGCPRGGEELVNTEISDKMPRMLIALTMPQFRRIHPRPHRP
jgi:hypothetical protein